MNVKCKLSYPFGLIISSVILIMILFSACNRNKKSQEYAKIVKYWMNRELVLPSDTVIIGAIGRDFNLECIDNKEFKIVTRIDGDCSVCIDELLEWKKMVQDYGSELNLSFHFYVATNNFEIFKKINKSTIRFPYPLIFDRLDDLRIKNNLKKDKRFNTFLLDRDNRVVLIGNPIRNKKIKQLYFEKIRKKAVEYSQDERGG
ncbi:hypothetical protein L3049_07885 [Labilibaculum sp. DW002]|uniref:Alkyl hydroperoxide reductase subunit C/ Thiol specific antioxidant domain-containing protein n=1 Tax=Paralabilibaculum antarcticum TaxID=2912572 RepID=A0ABT5VR73_9BACT|nr:hypothetical protein [Labilibaculum sp. DW002]MDE5417925.1 hypothetical protein [Labilibaculum sp. DW002]